MSRSPQLKVTVENLGPISAGEVGLRPLTILIGRNNTGKSYFAQLLYALFKAFRERVSPLPYTIVAAERDAQNRAIFESLARAVQASPNISIDDLPWDRRSDVVDRFHSIQGGLGPAIEGSLRECFGIESVGEIIRHAQEVGNLEVSLGNGFLSISTMAEGTVSTKFAPVPPPKIRVSRDDLDSFKHAAIQPVLTDWVGFLATRLWNEMLEKYSLPISGVFYVPAYRAGLLQSMDSILRLSLRALTVDWVRSNAAQFATIPQLAAISNGILVDFLGQIADTTVIRRNGNGDPLRSALDLLEGTLLEGGAVSGDVTKGESLVLYRRGEHTYPIRLASSMVAELAPLDLLLRRRINPGDLLIIDEPEAHLHPENQRLIARVVVRLVRAGVRVICATHSSLFLHQVSNHLLAAESSPEARSALKFTDSDVIHSDEVGVYLFAREEDGTHIRPVPIELGFGISEDEFVKVAEEIGDESFALSQAFVENRRGHL